MKTVIEKKNDTYTHENKKDIKIETVSIHYENGRLSRIVISGEFNYQTLEEKVVGLPDSDWIRLVSNKKIPINDFTFSGNHKIIHGKIKELIENLDNVTYLSIYEKEAIGIVRIESVPDKRSPFVDKITIKYVFNRIEKVELTLGGSDKTRKALMKVLNIPALDKISPTITKLSLKGKRSKMFSQNLITFLNTVNRSFELNCKNETCLIQLNTSDKFLYFNNKIYPLVIQMKEMYPQVANFLPEEIRKVFDKFSGSNTIIDFRTSTKRDYEKVLSKALTVLSKLNPPLPEYLTFDKNWFLMMGIAIQGSYEKLDADLNFLISSPIAMILKPLRIIVYDNKRKVVVIERPIKSDNTKNLLLEASKKFLRTEAIDFYPGESKNPETSNVLYYLVKYGSYHIITNKELLPTVVYNPSRFV
jgi:hypothetical protein